MLPEVNWKKTQRLNPAYACYLGFHQIYQAYLDIASFQELWLAESSFLELGLISTSMLAYTSFNSLPSLSRAFLE